VANPEPGWSSVEHSFPADHPTAAGHFPGNPIIPGALLLALALRALLPPGGARPPWELRQAKFLRPVRPGDRVEIRWRAGLDGQIRFEVRHAGHDEPALLGALVAPRA
jgi:3-hydroxymyristoyl/3-hydroxydecanoyl-(acyl carrier protein) dehydratase